MFTLNTITVVPSYICNLNCKYCGAEVPYLKNKKSHTAEEIIGMCKKVFEIVDYVHQIGISGGEPLVYKPLPELVEKLMAFSNQFDYMEIVTNGTIVPSQELLRAIKKCGKKFYRFIVDDYGKDKSLKVDEITAVLTANNIEFRINDYWSENMWCDGWTDMGSARHDIHTPEEAAEILSKCVYPRKGFCNIIHDGIVDPCGRIYPRINMGLDVNKDEYIDLNDDSITMQQNRDKITRINNAKYLDFCRHCNGLYPGVTRIKPAEQLTPEELKTIKESLW